jgi:FtsH-binding integral membrane protein
MDNYNQQEFSNYTVLDSKPATGTGTVAKKFMASVFLWMFVALGVSTLFAFLYATNQSLFNELYVRTQTGALRPSGLGWIVTFAPFAFILIMQFGINKLSAASMTFLFIAFAAVLGISLSYILLVYTSGSVIGCFASASVMFGVMAVMGYTTDKDLTSFGRILSMGLIGIFISMIINMFLHSSGLDYLISIIGVAVFTGLTAYDTQTMKRIGAGLEYEGTSASDTKKLALMGALRLYLDFLNLFLMLLRLFGNRRN